MGEAREDLRSRTVESRLRALVPSVQFISRLSIATLLLITPLMKLRLVTAFSPASLSTSCLGIYFSGTQGHFYLRAPPFNSCV
jgi:hypothetical protein